jgi:hypothetical protein
LVSMASAGRRAVAGATCSDCLRAATRASAGRRRTTVRRGTRKWFRKGGWPAVSAQVAAPQSRTTCANPRPISGMSGWGRDRLSWDSRGSARAALGSPAVSRIMAEAQVASQRRIRHSDPCSPAMQRLSAHGVAAERTAHGVTIRQCDSVDVVKVSGWIVDGVTACE